METPKFIDVEVALRYCDHPGSVDLSKATRITEKAAAALSRSRMDLNLDGIVEMSSTCARSLALFKGGQLSLKGLQKIDPEDAAYFVFLAHIKQSHEQLQFFRDACGERRYLDTNITNLAMSLNLLEATHISASAAMTLAGRTPLDLDNIKVIDLEIAKYLANCYGILSLRGLTEISADVLAALTRGKGTIILDGILELPENSALALGSQSTLYFGGITGICDSVAKILSKHENIIYLMGIKKISFRGVKYLQKKENIKTDLNYNSFFPEKIEISDATKYLKNSESIDFSKATHISVPAAEALSGCEKVLGSTIIVDLLKSALLAKELGEEYIYIRDKPISMEKPENFTYSDIFERIRHSIHLASVQVKRKEIKINKYIGEEKVVYIPSQINGRTVISISSSAFPDNLGITSIIIPSSITSINGSFSNCTELKEFVVDPDNDVFASSKSKRNGEREASDKSFKIFKRERVVTPLPF